MTVRLLYWAAALGAPLIGITLYAWGQPLICTCGHVDLWAGSVFSGGNSQHIADWYTLSHIVHGLLVAVIGRALGLGFVPVFAFAIFTGVGWEIFEHTDFVLDRFRATTLNQGYLGDSVLNAVMDYVFMMGGFAFASAVRTFWSFVLIVVMEIAAAAIARDSLVLETLMLIHPFETIENWQQELNPNRAMPQE